MQNPEVESKGEEDMVKEAVPQSYCFWKTFSVSLSSMSKEQRVQVEQEGMDEIQDLAVRLKDLILSQPPLALLSYVYCQILR